MLKVPPHLSLSCSHWFVRFFIPSVLLLAANLSSTLANEPPLEFLSNGTLIHLRVDGRDVLRESGQPNGFFYLIFNGATLKERALSSVSVDQKSLRITGPNGLPRLEFSLSEAGGKLSLELVRVEGMPQGEDISLLFRAAVSDSCTVQTAGKGVEVDIKKGVIKAYWIALGAPKQGASFGGITFNSKK